MSWFPSLVRIAGAGFPLSGVLVQLQNEVDAALIQSRLLRLEDPISQLDPRVREIAKILYEEVRKTDTTYLQTLRPEVYQKYALPLALLEGAGMIKGQHTFGGRFYAGLVVRSPDFVLYMAALYEDPVRMDALVGLVDRAPARSVLRGEDIVKNIPIPMPTIRAVFEMYERRGLGLVSQTLGTPPTYHAVVSAH